MDTYTRAVIYLPIVRRNDPQRSEANNPATFCLNPPLPSDKISAAVKRSAEDKNKRSSKTSASTRSALQRFFKGRRVIVKICILASSSAGNSALISTGRTRILIDAGLSRREISKRLAAIGEDICALDAIVVTHEHYDHTCGLTALVRRSERALPVYLTHGTSEFVDWGEAKPVLEVFQAGCSFPIGDFDISSFTIPHDAVDPVGFTLSAEGIKIAIATDLGYITDSLRVHLRGTNLLVLESNHDLEMLRVGPYPWSVKQRVMSRRGHLSNEVAAEFIEHDLDTCVSTLVLGHISEHNNHPELVRSLAQKALRGRELFTRLCVAEPGIQSEVFSY